MSKLFLLLPIFILTLFGYERSNFLKTDEVVIDLKRNLMWQDNSDAKIYLSNFTLAKEYCETLSFSGFTDWKLPNIKELQTIVDVERKEVAIAKEFENFEPSSYWSSTVDMSNETNAWYVGFKTGATFKDSKDYDCYVRCVRTRFKDK
ncbi:MAG: DUF1566 domain-containing protein [Campylobacterales bacterium]|nr:DUF1566 domain-containing protein [Campylobacterales bacterium]